MSKYPVLSVIICAMFISACAPVGTAGPAGGQEMATVTEEKETGASDIAPADDGGMEEAQVSDETPAEEKASGEGGDSKEKGKLHMTTLDGKNSEKDAGNEDVHEDGELTERELKIIGRDLNSDEYYGFLMSDYDDPKFIDWNEVLYNGAGIDEGYPSGEVEKEYLRKTGNFEIMTDLTVISGEKLEEFVNETTGLSYSKMRNPLDWTYLKNFDLYIFEHGDTNKISADIISGDVKNGVFAIRYLHNNWWGRNAGCEYTVSFTKNGDRYCFISNMPDESTAHSSNAEDYLIPGSDTRYITEEDIEGMDKETLRLARNEIFARYGRKFSDKTLQAYFDGKSWYDGRLEPDEITESSLNDYEKANIKLIKEHEK